MNSEESFFESDVVQKELTDIQETYTQLLKISSGLAEFSPSERLDHINKTLELIAKQKVFYSRLALASHNISGDENDEEATFVKEKIDTLSAQYSGGLNLMLILQQMEDKLRSWKKEIQDAES
tara:strand:- start:49 stop:417 length:369 start_codon:yes stop_codon:yes gene_type:complete